MQLTSYARANVKYIHLYRALRRCMGLDNRWEESYVVLSDYTERRLRLATVKRLGGKKGCLSGAIEEAVNDWLAKVWPDWQFGLKST